jgi:hypothetical protein
MCTRLRYVSHSVCAASQNALQSKLLAVKKLENGKISIFAPFIRKPKPENVRFDGLGLF